MHSYIYAYVHPFFFFFFFLDVYMYTNSNLNQVSDLIYVYKEYRVPTGIFFSQSQIYLKKKNI